MQYYGLADIGRRRKENQDTIFVCENNSDIKLFVVADGMGGANAGSVASSVAVEYVKEYIFENFYNNELTRENIEKLLYDALYLANNFVFNKSKEKNEYAGMGTTLIAVIVYKNKIYIGHIGDSRVYRIRNNIIRQLTKDHSYVQALVDSGSITKEEARNHPQKNVLLKVLGCEKDVEPDIITKGFLKGDVVLACSDGLTNMLENYEIFDIINSRKSDIKSACIALVDEANLQGGYDNISVVLISND